MASDIGSKGVTPIRFKGDPERAVGPILPIVPNESLDPTLDAELRGLVAPVVLDLLSICIDRWPPIDVARDGTALSLRLLSTCSIVGRSLVVRPVSRGTDCAGEL
jgi:hypothetical protein